MTPIPVPPIRHPVRKGVCGAGPGPCGTEGARLFPMGWRCPAHLPGEPLVNGGRVLDLGGPLVIALWVPGAPEPGQELEPERAAVTPAPLVVHLASASHLDRQFWVPPIRWSAYHVKRRQHCSECVAALQVNDGRGALEQAKHKRVSGTTELFLCQPHAELWRAEQTRRAA